MPLKPIITLLHDVHRNEPVFFYPFNFNRILIDDVKKRRTLKQYSDNSTRIHTNYHKEHHSKYYWLNSDHDWPHIATTAQKAIKTTERYTEVFPYNNVEDNY